MLEYLLIVLSVFLLGLIVFLFVFLGRGSNTKLLNIETQLASFEKNQERTERTIKNEIAQNREEVSINSKQLREEIVNSMTNIANLQKDQLDIFSKRITTLTQSNEQGMDKIRAIR
jgi:DNA recombination protein RmuC